MFKKGGYVVVMLALGLVIANCGQGKKTAVINLDKTTKKTLTDRQYVKNLVLSSEFDQMLRRAGLNPSQIRAQQVTRKYSDGSKLEVVEFSVGAPGDNTLAAKSFEAIPWQSPASSNEKLLSTTLLSEFFDEVYDHETIGAFDQVSSANVEMCTSNWKENCYINAEDNGTFSIWATIR
jgi:hypothetical protein